MIETKLFEVRDGERFYSVLATRVDGRAQGNLSPQSSWLLRAGGFEAPSVILGVLNRGDVTIRTSPSDWTDEYAATMPTAHDYIEKRWDDLQAGTLVDVAFIRGDTTEPTTSRQDSQTY